MLIDYKATNLNIRILKVSQLISEFQSQPKTLLKKVNKKVTKMLQVKRDD